MRRIRRIVLHHSAGRPEATVEDLRREHRARGWSDIGYHHLVHQVLGRWAVSPGRPVELAGAHDQGQNGDSIGVCVAGDYTQGPLPPAARDELLGVVRRLLAEHGLDVGAVEGHGEHEPVSSPTACPGYDVDELRELLLGGLRMS